MLLGLAAGLGTRTCRDNVSGAGISVTDAADSDVTEVREREGLP